MIASRVASRPRRGVGARLDGRRSALPPRGGATNQVSVLLEAARSLNRRLEVGQVMRALVRAGMHLTNASAGAAGQVSGNRVVFTEYLREGLVVPIRYSFGRGEGVSGHVLATRRPYIANDAAGDRHVLQRVRRALGFRNLVAVPILTRTGTLLGCLEIHTTRDGSPFGRRDVRILTGLADLAAAALSNALLMQHSRRVEGELRRANRALKTIIACEKALVRARNESQWLHEVCRLIVRVGGYILAWVGFAESDKKKSVRPVAQAGTQRGYVDDLRITWSDAPRGRGPTGTSIRTGRPCVVNSIRTDPRFLPWRNRAAGYGYAAAVGLPMISDGKVLGAITIYAPEPDAFDADEVELLAQLADDLTYGLVALRTRAQHRQAQESAIESRERLQEAQRIGRMGNWEVDLSTGGMTCSQQVFHLFERDPSLGPASLQEALRYLPPRERPALLRRVRQVVRRGRRTEFERRILLPGGRELHVHGIVRPLKDRRGRVVRLVGTVQDVTERKRAEDALREINATLEQRVAERTALAERRAALLRALAGELTLTEQRERKRIAGVLHEHLQQILVGAKYGLDLLRPRVTDPGMRQMIAKVDGSLARAIEVSRSLTVELRPPVLYELGLLPALHWLAEQMRARYGLTVHVRAHAAAEPPTDELRIFIFEAVRELLFNVAKHAKVQSAWLAVRRAGMDRVQVVVRDRGAGFDVAGSRAAGIQRGAFGLFSIRERLELLGGQLLIDSAPGRGSRLALLVPTRIRRSSAMTLVAAWRSEVGRHWKSR